MTQNPTTLTTPIVVLTEYCTHNGYDYTCPDDHTITLPCVGDGGDYQVMLTHCPLFASVHVQLTFSLTPPTSVEHIKTACSIVAGTVRYGSVSVQPDGTVVWSHTVPVGAVMTDDGLEHILRRALAECDTLYPLWHGVNAGQVDMNKLAQAVRGAGGF